MKGELILTIQETDTEVSKRPSCYIIALLGYIYEYDREGERQRQQTFIL